ncbi:MAG: M23 family metallopeptidase [Treponema sp.]|nr:M23 family metallopeptidase [Treponema sp.]MCL2251109.1 M23 family metallopeptidase [Treponema sp.]
MKKILFFVLLSIVLITGQQLSAQLRYTIIPESPRPGDPITIGVNTAVKEALLFVNGRQVAKAKCFHVPSDGRPLGFNAAIITVPSVIEANDAVIRLMNDSIVCEIPITIAPREFLSETIHLTPSLASLFVPNPQSQKEQELLWEIAATTGNTIYHTGPFVVPITPERRTSRFGTRRVNQYPDGRRTTSIHAGVDFGAPTGTEVRSCARGMVKIARPIIISGNSVVIEHAPGVYSIYYHLESIIIQEGAIAEAGELIGLVGSTGFSTGSHLHWEIRVSTENTDPDEFVSRPLIDKELIISRILN